MSQRNNDCARELAGSNYQISQDYSNDQLHSFQVQDHSNQNQNYLSPHHELTSENEEYVSVFKNIKSFIAELSIDKNYKNENFNEGSLDKQLEDAKTIVSLNHEIAYYKDIVLSHEKKLEQNEEHYDKTVKENQNRHRKEIKKYIELVNQKEHESQSLKKTIKSQNSQIQNLNIEIQSLIQTKINLENTILKSIESMKTNLKEFNYSFEENDLDKVVLQGKYKQLCDKVQHVVKQNQDSEIYKLKVQKKYEKLKEVYEVSRNQCIEMRFEIQRLKIKLKDRQNIQKSNYKQQLMGKNSLFTQNDITQLKQRSKQIINNIKQIQQKKEQIKQYLITNGKFQQLINQNIHLKDRIEMLLKDNDDLKFKLQGSYYENQILENRNPSLWQTLCQKKKNIENLQMKIEEIEKIAYKAQQLLQMKIQQGINEGTKLLQNSDKKTKEKLQKQKMIQQFQIIKLKIIAQEKDNYEKLRDSDKQLVKELQNHLHAAQEQNQRLKKFNESLTAQMKKLRSIVSQPQQIGKKKKTAGKTKGKIKCDVCNKQVGQKFSKCQECLMRYHADCIQYHECSYKTIEDFITYDSLC